MGVRHIQRGISAPGLLIGLAGLAAVITLVLRLGPHYIDWRTMQSVFGGLPANQVHTMPKNDLKDMIGKRFRINNLRDFDIDEIVVIERQKGTTTLVVSYERREPIIGNADVVLSFSERYQYQ